MAPFERTCGRQRSGPGAAPAGGFRESRVVAERSYFFGTLVFYQATRGG